MSEKHIFNNKWLTEKEIRELCEKVGCSCPDDTMTQAANTPAAIRVFFEEIGYRKAISEARRQAEDEKKNIINSLVEKNGSLHNENIVFKDKIENLEKQLKEAKEKADEAWRLERERDAARNTQNVLIRINEDLEKQLKEAKEELKEETEMQELSCEFADDSTKKLMDRIKDLEKQFSDEEIIQKFCEKRKGNDITVQAL